MKNIMLILFLFSICFGPVLKAEEIDSKLSYKSFLQQELMLANQTLEYVSEQNNSNTVWYLRLIRMQVSADVGLKVPYLAKFILTPQVEFFFKR